MPSQTQKRQLVILDASEKLIALCEGLQIEHLSTFLALGQIGDFRALGKRIMERVKEIKLGQ